MQGSRFHKKYKVYLDRVGVAKVPENYEERPTEIFPKVFKHLRVLALDPYHLALSKLERNIQRDRDHVKHLAKTTSLAHLCLAQMVEWSSSPRGSKSFKIETEQVGIPPKSLPGVLATLRPQEQDFPTVYDLPPDRVDVWLPG